MVKTQHTIQTGYKLDQGPQGTLGYFYCLHSCFLKDISNDEIASVICRKLYCSYCNYHFLFLWLSPWRHIPRFINRSQYVQLSLLDEPILLQHASNIITNITCSFILKVVRAFVTIHCKPISMVVFFIRASLVFTCSVGCSMTSLACNWWRCWLLPIILVSFFSFSILPLWGENGTVVLLMIMIVIIGAA